MKKLTLLMAALLILTLAGSGCKKQQPPPPQMPPQGTAGQPGAAGPHGEGGPPPAPKAVDVPEAVKGNWKAVKLQVEYKEKKAKKDFTVPLNSEFKVPDSDLTLKVGAFLPHFTMGADKITSASNKPENPAVQLEVMEGGKEIFHGWLFSKYPSVHPFSHDKYAVSLVEGVKK